MNNKHKSIKSEIVYKGQFINVRIDTIEKNGHVSQKEIIESKSGVVIAFISPEEKILLISQYRHNRGEILELPAGSMKDNETPLQAAKRELLEETGLKAKHWKLISTHQNGVHQEGADYFFMARGQTNQTLQSLDLDEHITTAGFYDFAYVAEFIKQNRIPDLRSKACIWLTKLILESGWVA